MQRAKPSRRRAALALAAVGTVVAVALVELPSGASGGANFVLLGGLTPAAAPARITSGPDGNLWFTEPGISKVGRITPTGVITEFATATGGASPTGITAGPDGNVWFTEPAVNRVGAMTPTGAASDIALAAGSAPERIVTGPDHNLWVTEPGAHAVARVTTGGTVTVFALNDPTATPTDITSGPDGNLWFTETHGHFIGRISTAGAIAEFSAPGVTTAGGITTGPDGALWFGEGTGKLGRLTTAGVLSEWATPTSTPGITDVTPGNDGNVWFAEQSAAQIGAITPGGVVTEWPVPNHDAPGSLVLGPDTNVWFAAASSNIIGHVTAVANGATTTTSSSSTSSSTSSTSTSTTSTTTAGHVTVARLSGSDRVGTAIAISAQAFATKGSAKAVVLASGWSFPDALAGAPLAAAKGGPLLLTPTASLDARVKTEIARVLPSGGTVYVLGGPQAVDPSVDAALVTAGFQVSRLAGTDRYNTATMIAGALGDPATVYEATGLDFPDALSAAALAAINHGAILLTNGAQQATQTAAYLSAHANDTRAALGGAAAAADPSATPIAGKDRFETSAKAAALVPSPSVVGAASAYAFPDALAGGAAIGAGGGPLLLVPPSGTLPGSVLAWCTASKPGVTKVEVFGGQAAVADAVANAIKAALGG